MLKGKTDVALFIAAALGFGLLQGARFLDPGSGPYSQSEWALLGLAVDGLTFLFVALLSYFARIERANVLFSVAVCATVIHVASTLLGFGSLPVVQAIAGLGWALNVLCWMSVFTSYNPRTALLLIALGYFLNVAIKPFSTFLGGNVIVWYVVAYLLSIVLLFISLRRREYIAQRDKFSISGPTTVLSEALSRTIRAVIATAVFSFICGFAVRSDFLKDRVAYAQTDLTAWMCLAVALLMIIILSAFKVPKANIDYIVPIAGIIMGSALVARVAGAAPEIAGSLMVCTLITFYVLLWLAFVSEAHIRLLPAFFLLGLALAAARLGVALGQFAAGLFFSSTELSYPNVSILLMWVLLLTACVSYFAYLRYSARLREGRFNLQTDKELAAEESHVEESSDNLAASERAIDDLIEKSGLSSREADVIREYAVGRSSRYIADLLMISEHTVKTHLRRAYTKFGVHSRQELLDAIEAQEAHIRAGS